MTHRLFYTDRNVAWADYRANKANLFHFVYDDLDDALAMARDINARGGVAWEIETDGDATIGRREITRLIQDKAGALIGRPRIY